MIDGVRSPVKAIVRWTPETYRSKRGRLYQIAFDKPIATGITKAEAIRQYPHLSVCYDRDGATRDRDGATRDMTTGTLKCPVCGEDVWDLPFASKLAKCWNFHPGVGGTGTLAFMPDEEDDDEEDDDETP